jgi:hypothetical protein
MEVEKEEKKEEEKEVVVDTLIRIARELYPSVSEGDEFQENLRRRRTYSRTRPGRTRRGYAGQRKKELKR